MKRHVPSASRLLPAASRLLPAACRLLPLLLLAASAAAQEVDSGLPVGEFADQFLVKDCTGPAAGKTLCYYCRYADRPVVAVFVRELSDEVERLVQRLDAAVAGHQRQRLAAFVILLDDDTRDSESRLKRLAKRLRLRHTPLTIYRDQAAKLTEIYRLSPRAAVTLLAWRRGKVTANRAFATARLKPADAERFLAEVKRSLP